MNENVESFEYEDRRFVFYDLQVAFDEASIICEEKGRSGSLAMLIDEDAAQFVAIALSETTIGTSFNFLLHAFSELLSVLRKIFNLNNGFWF